MLLLHRYLVREFLRVWGLTLGTLLLVSQVIEVFTRVRRYADHPLPLGPFLAYLMLHFPQTLLILSPIAVLLATIISLGLLTKRRELFAMRSIGFPPRQIALPFFIFGLMVSGLLAAANWTVIPVATRQSEYIKNTVLLQRPQTSLFGQNRVWLQLDSHRLMNIQLIDPTTNILYDVSLYQLDDEFSLVRLTEAASIVFQNNQWRISQGTQWDFRPDRSVKTESLRDQPIELSKGPAEFREMGADPDEMDGPQLGRYIAQLQRSGLNSARYQINLDAKLSIPAVNVLMVMIGVPLGMLGGRWSHVARGIGLALAVAVAYALIHAYAIALGNKEILPVGVAAWLADALLFGLGGWLLIRLR